MSKKNCATQNELLSELQNIYDTELDKDCKFSIEVKRVERMFIKNLITKRKEMGLTQKDIADRTGLTQQAVSTLEKCDRKPTLPNLIKYLLGLNIDINDLFL